MPKRWPWPPDWVHGLIEASAELSARRALRQRVEQVAVVLQRNAMASLAADALLVYGVARNGALWLALAWLLAIQTVLLLRRRSAARVLADSDGDPAAAMQQLVRWSALLGAARAVIVVVAFVVGSADTQVLVTMVVVGLAAGAVATCGGEPRILKVWSYPALGSLALAWSLKLSWETAVIALLIVYLNRALVGYVEYLGNQGRQLIDYAAELETERDRVREANIALARSGEELRAERDRAAEANAAKTRVLASVSHDLRQPLFALSLNTAALGDVLENSDDATLKRIESGLRRGLTQCRGLLDQLVDFSRLEAGTVEVRWRAVELAPFLQALSVPYEAAAHAAGLQWHLQHSAAPLWVWTDALLLERMIGNLLQNAIKFTLSGQVGLRVQPLGQGDRIGIEVFDSGPGIPRDQQERVFEEFFQLDNPSRDRSRGLGLGLSIVRRLAELLSIELRLHSEAGRGCRFALALMVSRGAATVHEPAADRNRPAPQGRQRVVLAIDDEVDLLADLKTLLGGRGWQMLAATDAEAAVAHALTIAPDIVIADFRLRHDRTGLEAIRAVRRAIGRDVPALLITGDTAPKRIAEATASGLRVLHKPLDGHALAQALHETLEVGQPVQA